MMVRAVIEKTRNRGKTHQCNFLQKLWGVPTETNPQEKELEEGSQTTEEDKTGMRKRPAAQDDAEKLKGSRIMNNQSLQETTH